MIQTLFFVAAATLVLIPAVGAADQTEGFNVEPPGDPLINDVPAVFEIDLPPLSKGIAKAETFFNPATQPVGALTGRVVYTSGGHGWTANNPGNGVWFTQRGINNGMIEDLGNGDQLFWFAEYCFNAGATVVPFRPIGYQTNEVVLDNDDSGVQFVPGASWGSSVNPQYFGGAADTAHYRFAQTSTTQTAVARYTPNLPEAGSYPVYAWTRDGTDRVEDQLYRIVHTGGATEVRVNHRRVGKGWIYLGTYYFDAGTAGCVEISNQSSDTSGSVVIADAIRFGNGMGDIGRAAGVSGKPRLDEASLYWIEGGVGQGAPSEIHARSGLNDQENNVSAPIYMTGWMNREQDGNLTDRVYLGFHSNAFDPGSLGLFNGNNIPDSTTPNQLEWATIIASELNTDLVAIGSPPFENPWPDRVDMGLSLVLDRNDIEFGEIRGDRMDPNDLNNSDPEMDATIIEVAAHGNADEAELMRDLKVRKAVARASVQATIRYFNQFGNGPLVFPPAPPTHLEARAAADGTVTVKWQKPPFDTIVGDEATGYVVYRSVNGYGFGNPTVVSGGNTTSHTFSDVSANTTTYFRVVASNVGGESLPPEPVVTRRSPSSTSSRLIVNGFDRIDRALSPTEFSSSGIGGPTGGGGSYNRVIPRQINAGDYVVEHAQAIAARPAWFDSCSNEAVTSGSVSLTDYDTVFWICGEESSNDETLDAMERAALTAFLANGGRLFISGAEIGWDLVALGGDASFYEDTLRGNYVSDDSNSYSVDGDTGTIFEGVTLNFAPTTTMYDANFPDVISPINGSVRIARYSTGGGAALAYEDGGSGSKIVMMGFPFETIRDVGVRRDLMDRVLEFFDGELVRASTWSVE